MGEQNLVGKKLGDYILLKKLTSGGMAHIYLGEDEKLQRRAAIKVLTSDLAGDDDILRERFEREGRAVAQLEHDSIVPIYQFGEEGNLYFIAMRYIEGNDLADEMKRYKSRGEKMPPERMLSILKQVASGLDHAHKRGIIHRDVKPSNVLLRNNQEGATGDKAVLTDFGLVLWEDVDKTLGTAFGTPRYISPEQATDSQSAVPQSDIYSLAVIVYEILTGEVLFKGATPMEVALSHITESPTPPRAHNSDIPVDAQNEILKALQKDADKRHQTAMQFINALRHAYNLDDTQPLPLDELNQSEQVRTKPFRDEVIAKPDSKDSQDSKNVLDSWDKIPTPQDTKEDEKSTQVSPSKGKSATKSKEDDSGGLPLPLIGGAVVVIAIIFAVIVGLNNSGGDGGEQNNDSDTPAVVVEGANMAIEYNEDFFAIVNTSETLLLDISDISITGDDGTSSPDLGDTLAPSGCVFVRRGGVQNSELPSSWGCEGEAVASISSANVFWRAETADDENFTVSNGSQTVATCDTAGRAVGRAGDNSCELEWSDATEQ